MRRPFSDCGRIPAPTIVLHFGYHPRTKRIEIDVGSHRHECFGIPLDQKTLVPVFPQGAFAALPTVVLGSEAFVNQVFERNRAKFGKTRQSGARVMREADWNGLCVLRDLRKEVMISAAKLRE